MKFFVIALAAKDRNNPVLKAPLVERVRQFALHPHGPHRFRREDDHKPIAATQSQPDFFLPLLRASQMRPTIPDTDSVAAKHSCQLAGERAIAASVGEKDFPRLTPLLPFQTLVGVSSNPWST